MSDQETYSLRETCERLGCGGRTALALLAEDVIVGVVAENGMPTFTRESVDRAAERGIGRGSREYLTAPATFEVRP